MLRYEALGGLPARRDGIFATVYMATFLAGGFGKGLSLIALGLSGFEPQTAGGESPPRFFLTFLYNFWLGFGKL